MTEKLFRTDAYLKTAVGRVTRLSQGGVVLDSSVFYAQGGGQPGDAGRLSWDKGEMAVSVAVNGEGDDIVLQAADGAVMPEVGTQVTQTLDWDRRYTHMRIHTALHLLSVAVPLPVTGGSISAEKGRLDFDMPEPVDKDELTQKMNEMIALDLPVTDSWITDEELLANPGLVKTMSVQPPIGAGRVRLVRIGEGDRQIDLQPCGGTHVARTSEIGPVRIGKIEKKGRQNRRVNLFLGAEA